jgi:uncharacterized protein (DUF2147 family)
MSPLRAIFLPLMILAALRPAHAADEVFERWATPGVSAVVELAPCSDGVTLCGTIRSTSAAARASTRRMPTAGCATSLWSASRSCRA